MISVTLPRFTNTPILQGSCSLISSAVSRVRAAVAKPFQAIGHCFAAVVSWMKGFVTSLFWFRHFETNPQSMPPEETPRQDLAIESANENDEQRKLLLPYFETVAFAKKHLFGNIPKSHKLPILQTLVEIPPQNRLPILELIHKLVGKDAFNGMDKDEKISLLQITRTLFSMNDRIDIDAIIKESINCFNIHMTGSDQAGIVKAVLKYKGLLT